MSPRRYTRRVSTMDDHTDQRTMWRDRRHRMRLECRECDVICERVVYPWRCLRSNCEYVYAYEDGDTMYFGCLGKVFSAEFDIAVFTDSLGLDRSGAKMIESAPSEKRTGLDRPGQRRRSMRSTDPFGSVRLNCPPRPQCHVKIEQAYDSSSLGAVCSNPTFFHREFGSGGDSIKLTAAPPIDPDSSKS